MSMFNPVDAGEEAAILAAADTPRRGKRGPDLSIRTNTAWFKLETHYGDCQVEDHEDNVTDDEADKGRRRMVYSIESTNVCRWCFIAGRP